MDCGVIVSMELYVICPVLTQGSAKTKEHRFFIFRGSLLQVVFKYV